MFLIQLIIIKICHFNPGGLCHTGQSVDICRPTDCKPKTGRGFRAAVVFATGAPALQEPAVSNLKPELCLRNEAEHLGLAAPSMGGGLGK